VIRVKKKLSRRKFVAAAGLGALASRSFNAMGQAPQILTPSAIKPLVISAANGNHSNWLTESKYALSLDRFAFALDLDPNEIADT
jgi:hypothetical protein